MSIQEFVATKRPCADLGAALTDESLANVGGLLYLGCLFIEDTKTWGSNPGARWYTVIERAEYRSDSLADIETVLYDFAISEGYTA